MTAKWPPPLTHLVQDIYIQYASEWDVWPSKVRGVRERDVERSGDNELHSSEERSKVAVKVVLLLTGLAAGRGPQLDGVSGDLHVN